MSSPQFFSKPIKTQRRLPKTFTIALNVWTKLFDSNPNRYSLFIANNIGNDLAIQFSDSIPTFPVTTYLAEIPRNGTLSANLIEDGDIVTSAVWAGTTFVRLNNVTVVESEIVK